VQIWKWEEALCDRSALFLISSLPLLFSLRAKKRSGIMAKKPKYEELEKKIKELEKEAIERRRAEEALQDSEERYRSIVENSHAGIHIVDDAYRLIYVNNEFCRILGRPPEEIIGQDFRTFLHEESRELVSDYYVRRQRGEELPSRYEISVVHKDGEKRQVEISVTVLRDSQNNVRTVAQILDISEQRQVEELLGKEKSTFFSILQTAPYGVVLIDQSGSYQYINPEFTRITGYTLEDVPTGREWLKKGFPGPTYKRRIAKYWYEDVSKKGSNKVLKVTCKGGEVKYLDIRPTLMEDGRAIMMLSDVTARGRAEEALRASEERYRTTLEGMEEGYYEADLAGNFTFFNDSLCEMLGYPRHELLGLNNRQILREETAKWVYQNFNEVYRTGKPLIAFDHEVIRKDGNKRYVELSASLRKDGKGYLLGFHGIIRDITDRKAAEKEIKKRERYLESVLYNAPDAIVTLDASYRIIEWNPGAEQVFGYTRDEVFGKNLDEIIAKPIEVKTLIKQVFTGKRLSPQDIVCYRKDGTPVDVIVAASPIQIDGEFQGAVAVYTDITEPKRAEEEKKALEAQLRYAQKMEAIGTLAGGIAHNFNNLLMGIQGNTSLMLLETDSSHPNYSRLKSIEKSVQSGAKLTSQLLGYAREGRYEIKPLNVNRLVRETSDTFATAKREIRVHRELDEDPWGILADQGQIEQVLLNLYVNAADAMPTGGDLFLKTEKVTHLDIRNKSFEVKPGNYVLITVRDTGVGMDKKTIERIFDPFFTTKGMSRGTGLGLASVYGIIKAHGGYIDVESNKGEGATFSIYLPASRRKVREEGEPSLKIATGTETVLLVDDEEMILEVSTQMLETMGYKVMVARGGKEAIEVYEKSRDAIDLVILDMVMPDMGGGAAYDRMREINPEIKVLLSSGYSIDGQAAEIMERGCDGFIQKPFDVKELSRKIREVLGKL
jgi:two-component system cell cycle sensor histidine kinase/response regulator CckA